MEQQLDNDTTIIPGFIVKSVDGSTPEEKTQACYEFIRHVSADNKGEYTEKVHMQMIALRTKGEYVGRCTTYPIKGYFTFAHELEIILEIGEPAGDVFWADVDLHKYREVYANDPYTRICFDRELEQLILDVNDIRIILMALPF